MFIGSNNLEVGVGGYMPTSSIYSEYCDCAGKRGYSDQFPHPQSLNPQMLMAKP